MSDIFAISADIEIMGFWSSDIVRIITAAFLANLVGGIYYNPSLNPLARMWKDLVYPGISDPTTIVDPTLPIAAAGVCKLIASVIMNRYVNIR